jgi:hypothetical protein
MVWLKQRQINMMKLIFSQHLATMCKSYSKTCLKCRSVNTKKDWKRKWRQSYRCKKCWYVWIGKLRNKTKVNIEKLYESFSNHKQTYKELSDAKEISIKTVQKYLDMKVISTNKAKPRKVVLLIDTTYFWSFGLMLFKDAKKKDIINYKIVDYETNDEYRKWIEELIIEWWEIEAIVSDWRRWLLWIFDWIPSQMCHFHQKQIIRRYIRKKPILEPNIELNEIVKWLHKTDKWTFKSMIEKRHEKHKIWLNEKWINSKWKRYFIHKKTRSAYLSLKRNLKYLFTYLDYYWKIDIPNTTNWIESVFSHIKYKVNLHRWLRKDRKIKLILNLLKI